jgi:hypothetical protein
MTPIQQAKEHAKQIQANLGALSAEISKNRLSKLSGVERANMRPIFTGSASCSLYTAVALAHALGYTLKLVKSTDDEK